ncbi:uncharacterized protein LOC112844604 [Oreochromis niloticus]|uniref:uncharacterized protein LOC112844604 n=1 Tax=Oreochromis niloticus TaxID=8128 RepID=UPI000DF3EB81|nr:uncharacterized protein LOC112844604 [Oreochromis niloticus]
MLPDKIKRETEEREEREVRPRSPAHRVRETALRLSAEAGFSPGLARLGTFSHSGRDSGGRESTSLGALSRDVNKHGGAQQAAANIKTPKFSGKTPWEVFIAQFELLAVAAGWSEEHKALQLALCLCEDAAACLLLLTEEQRGDYNALVGALQRRFGQYNSRLPLGLAHAADHRAAGDVDKSDTSSGSAPSLQRFRETPTGPCRWEYTGQGERLPHTTAISTQCGHRCGLDPGWRLLPCSSDDCGGVLYGPSGHRVQCNAGPTRCRPNRDCCATD